ncbi:LPS-assembly protein LptD [Aurantimonas sp. C2-6-R+9]|uniref:LPS-assembly protein LptD n=1 Tax=unclassified Aurantimonas TaxID=2638230 RepID=UPI002E17E4BD|nr:MULTISPECIES: LPS-assembly protein LptD [unclassified Aurantimonas]MEC5290648.1 LPS-assembly protein LptD [Aurantimonas sp. C2-3-R2]MEC5380638.1 LPS-assembly protein LptD [Aurantimonas sp. C2-6-R+9]MEC5411684.1 LPS-assembly protein LptD [Aurantimonas sp. C2-4-R8]
MFLEADTVTYDSDSSVVTASGGVQIDYGSYKLVARQVVYDQKTRRLVASGDVELQQPDGNKLYADTIDITDDFRDGFVKALRIEAPDNTRFAATEAVRRDGSVTTFQQGVYTACEACRAHPDRAPLWQVKARKIVWDQTEKEIRYYGARFEFFGAPIAYLPYFQSPDPTVKRKSGFLTPAFRSSEELGYGLRVPYFIALSDDKDVTVAGTYYTKQGFLAEAEYRQAVSNGFFTLQTAGIIQQDPGAFADKNTASYTTPDFANTDRGMIGTTGRFALNERWTVGWDILLQSDENFSATYDIANFGSTLHTSEIYLTGLGDQSYFDLRGQKFEYQSVNPNQDDTQPLVAPAFDYERIEQETVLGGEVKLDLNVASLYRDEDSLSRICEPSAILEIDSRTVCRKYRTDILRYNGLEGDYSRGTAQAAWSDTYTLSSGLVLSPTASLRGDLFATDMESDGIGSSIGALTRDESGARGMATAAIEARYPYLIETANASHVIEPIGQIVVRPDETQIGFVPNEDAQSLVFNTGNLFQLDKFSGYDRIEGGTRANIGLRYAGTLDSGYTIDTVVGQSYQLGGINSFAQTDLALVGFDSGLETDRSDYVTSLAFGTPIGLEFGAQGRFDEVDYALRRSDVYGSYSSALASAQITYTNIAAQPTYGSISDRSQVTASGSLKFAENWTASGALGYDIENSAVVEKKFGIGYADECFSLLVSYSDTIDRYTQESNSKTLMFQVGLRTISDFSQSYDLSEEK